MASAAEKERVLVVDDAPDTLELIERNLTANRYEVFTAPGVAEATRILESTPVDLVITDLKMPKVSGMDLVRHIHDNFRDTEVMMITGYPTVEGAVTAVAPITLDFAGIRQGADISGDGMVDISDLAAFADQWLGADPESDFDADGTVNLADLEVISRMWMSKAIWRN